MRGLRALSALDPMQYPQNYLVLFISFSVRMEFQIPMYIILFSCRSCQCIVVIRANDVVRRLGYSDRFVTMRMCMYVGRFVCMLAR